MTRKRSKEDEKGRRLSEFDIVGGREGVAETGLEGVDLFVGEGTVHAAVGDAETLAGPSTLGVHELIDALDVLHQIPCRLPRQLTQRVVAEREAAR